VALNNRRGGKGGREGARGNAWRRRSVRAGQTSDGREGGGGGGEDDCLPTQAFVMLGRRRIQDGEEKVGKVKCVSGAY